MRIKVRYFASLRERLGKTEEVRDVPAGATVATVWQLLVQEHPELHGIERSIAFAVAQEYVDKDHPLQDNDELACIPPVSGGVMGGVMSEEEPRILSKITQEPIDMQELSDFVADPGAGAMATFVGMTRNTNEGRDVVRLEYECYPGMAEKEITKIGQQALARWPIAKIAMIHRIGRVDIGEASVAIAVSSGHRHAAFEACHYAINTLKETVPIWKKELYTGGELWIGSQTGNQGTMQRVQDDSTTDDSTT